MSMPVNLCQLEKTFLYAQLQGIGKEIPRFLEDIHFMSRDERFLDDFCSAIIENEP